MYEPSDEISLRELYVILRGALLWVLPGALAVAAVAFLAVWHRPHQYQATATVRISPLQVTSQGADNGQLDLKPVTNMSFDTFESIALSAPVLDRALASVPSSPASLTAKALATDVTVKDQTEGNAGITAALQVRLPDGAMASTVANAWARASVAGAQDALAASITSIGARLSQQQVTRRKALDGAQSKWSSFESSDNRSSLHAQLDALATKVASLKKRLMDLDATGARAKAQQDPAAVASAQGTRQSAEDLLSAYQRKTSSLRNQLSTLDMRATRLQDDLARAKQAYDAVAQLALPTDVLEGLVPAMANVVSPASIPLAPQPSRTVMVTGVAFVLAFFALVLVAFLRAAVVAEPLSTPTDVANPAPQARSGAIIKASRGVTTGAGPSPNSPGEQAWDGS